MLNHVKKACLLEVNILIRKYFDNYTRESGLGTIKTTITIDEDVWKRFTLIVIEKYGYRKKTRLSSS